jgi:tRNA (mo5U34)-methyltransferase
LYPAAAMSPPTATADPRTQIDAVERWYHTLEVAPGVVTPGLFDLRPIVERLPWPDVRGKRCLDVGTADGFLAFELERRGAAEVVALDLPSHAGWDWEAHMTEIGPRYLDLVFGPAAGNGFAVAHRLRGSNVVRVPGSVYDLSPERHGRFDVVVCGSLLLHLRDPLRALAAIHSVCAGAFLCTNQIDPGRSLLAPHQPLLRLDGTSGETQWWLPNVAGHRQLLLAGGFRIERESRPYGIPFGVAHPPRPNSASWLVRRTLRRLMLGNNGVPHHAILARA